MIFYRTLLANLENNKTFYQTKWDKKLPLSNVIFMVGYLRGLFLQHLKYVEHDSNVIFMGGSDQENINYIFYPSNIRLLVLSSQPELSLVAGANLGIDISVWV